MDYKTSIKKIITRLYSDNEQEIINKINDKSIKVISFDLFDTLVTRDVSDYDYIYKMLESAYKDKYACNDKIQIIRINAEIKARKRSCKEEINIEDIYDEFPAEYKSRISWLIQKEIELVISLCEKNNHIDRVYNEALKSGKRVFIISDTYLPKSCIEKILRKTGYGVFENIYVSSEFGYTKRNSKLYRRFHIDNGFSYEAHLHIGDAIISDYLVPNKLKIKSSLVKKAQNKTFFISDICSKKVACDLMLNFINNTVIYDDFFQRLGYEVLGPLLYGYITWLQKEVEKQSIHKIYFLAREGILLDKAFEIVQKNQTTKLMNEIEHEILRVSRRATTIPLGNTAESIQQKKNIEGYLKEKGFYGIVAIADVGWRGTIQKNLNIISAKKANIKGFYYGIVRKANDYMLDNAKAYAFSPTNSSTRKLYDVIMASPSLFELFFLSTDGTTVSYDNDFNPVIGDSEQINESNKRINKLQEAAISFVDGFSKCVNECGMSIQFTADDVFVPYENMLRNNSMKLIKNFMKFNHVDIIGEKFLPQHNLAWYLAHPTCLISDLKKSGVKALFLKKLLRIKLPYVEIVALLRKVFD